MATAIKELTDKMADAAYVTFPRGRTSLPVWTTSSTLIQLHDLSYVPSSQKYTTTIVESYFVTGTTKRQKFVVDLFKILKWVVAIQEPNGLMHLVPQVRTLTPNGHYVTWLKTGLFKEFKAKADIDMALIRRIYNDTSLQHVERGLCHRKSVTITSIGRTLQHALSDFEGKRHLILDGVKKALDELHHIGVAH